MKNRKIKKYKKQLLDFTIKGCSDFLEKNPEKVFYGFVYDCNTDSCEVNLCFNTEVAFMETLEYYRNGRYKESYDTENEILSLKYNTGDWEYQCVETIYFESEEVMRQSYGNDMERQATEIMEMCREILEEFKLSSTYRKIPKTDDFIAYCINHDDDELEIVKQILHK